MSKHPVPLFPENDKHRKMIPMFAQQARYFPRAEREITKVSVVNNVRYNPERAANDINWARTKSTLQLDSAFHHMLEHAVDGKIFDKVDPKVAAETGIERIYILAQAAWRIKAELELLIEKVEREEYEAANAQPVPSPHTAPGREADCQCGAHHFKGVRDGEMPPVVMDPNTGILHNLAGCQRI